MYALSDSVSVSYTHLEYNNTVSSDCQLLSYWANLLGLILTPGPIVEATTQDLMY